MLQRLALNALALEAARERLVSAEEVLAEQRLMPSPAGALASAALFSGPLSTVWFSSGILLSPEREDRIADFARALDAAGAALESSAATASALLAELLAETAELDRALAEETGAG